MLVLSRYSTPVLTTSAKTPLYEFSLMLLEFLTVRYRVEDSAAVLRNGGAADDALGDVAGECAAGRSENRKRTKGNCSPFALVASIA